LHVRLELVSWDPVMLYLVDGSRYLPQLAKIKHTTSEDDSTRAFHDLDHEFEVVRLSDMLLGIWRQSLAQGGLFNATSGGICRCLV